MIAILVFFRYKIDLNKAIRNKYNVIKYAYAFLLLISLSTLFVLIGKRSIENKLYRMYLEDRNTVMDVVKDIKLSQYKVSDIFDGSDIILNKEKKNTLIFIINSIDCNTCIDEAIYVEYLANKYKSKLRTIAVTGITGKTAINNLIDRYKITYKIIHERSPVLQKLINIKTLKLLVNSEGIILNIDPATFKSKRIRGYYENILMEYINKEVI